MIDKSWLMTLVKSPYKISSLKSKEFKSIFEEVHEILKNERIIIEISQQENDVGYVIGDLHGNLQSLIFLVKLILKTHPNYVIFLGDLVDRGQYQMECLVIVISLKILFPHCVYILSGNHESLEINKAYGFYKEYLTNYRDVIDFNLILNVYNSLPIGGIINNRIFCVHGGIPEDFYILRNLKNKKASEFIYLSQDLKDSIFQMKWNDPKEDLKGFSNSFRGFGIKFFGEDVYAEFLKENNLKYVIRSHEYFNEGYRWFFNQKLLSIFSSFNYYNSAVPTPASYAVIEGKKITPKKIYLLEN